MYQPSIQSGGLTMAQYRSGPMTFSGAHTSDTLSIKVGTGTVEWINNTGDGPQSITCDADNQCDLVVQVSIVGDTLPATYFIQQQMPKPKRSKADQRLMPYSKRRRRWCARST